MRKQENRTLAGSRAFALLLLAWLVLATVCGCPQIKEWRDEQIATSHSLAANPQAVQVPATPVRLPADVERTLPIAPDFTVISYGRSGGQHHCLVLSTKGVEETVQWVMAEMQSKGYAIDDNPSRVLEGVDFTSEKSQFHVIKVKVEQNSAAQVLIIYELAD